MSLHTRLTSTLALCLLTATAMPAAAQYWPGAPRDNRAYQSRAYEYGYQDGLSRGETDARANRAYALDQSREYQRADRGYDRRYGNVGSYQQVYRNAYATGYREGYERYSRNGGYARPRPNTQRYPTSPNTYPNYPNYPGQPGYGYGYGYSSPGFEAGFADGYEKGVDDAEDRDRFDPLRHGRYKSADRGYERHYGSKDAYKNAYREGFRSGYERGYRDTERYGSRARRSRTGTWWPF